LTSISRPVVVVGDESPALHHALGIWKSPMNVPDAAAVSIRVNPVPPKPVSEPTILFNAVKHEVFVGVVHN